ncbi:His-Xaa-Ser system radical SAM maturase HxsC [Noviherbaspirillum autotrophicum]|nr:His-Xaa-Ser system radical SAM maturase HxsC [Noviherbaspirillum autotrophicum]
MPALYGLPTARQIYRVTNIEDVAAEWAPGLRFLVKIATEDDVGTVARLIKSGLTGLSAAQAAGLEIGDIVLPIPDKDEVIVLYRESDLHHSLFLTNRCNSYCLMCSQPPTKQDDSWLVEEAIDIVRHIRVSPSVLGISGGEPLLLGAGLRKVLDCIEKFHPETHIEVLTNGRLFCNPRTVEVVLSNLTAQATWLVPLYGHADFVHDFVVQTPGAFEETLAGLLALREARKSVQLRVVLIEPTLRVLPELCGFVGRNLPFVREVALMGCEPIGFALANREQCEVDLAEWTGMIDQAGKLLRRLRVPFVLMNVPLCALPKALWKHAHRSISDWKNVYANECSSCEVKDKCAGLFAWHERGWKPATIRPITEGAVL